ncbi:MAG: sulfotransferase family protein [Nitrospinota bacterium]|nr:MAG: sulfotransferase family protein [Nitrospinota bacterium]
MPLSIIGAGFGRTGTFSLKMALEMLGVGRCYHMAEVIENPEHVAVWSKAAEGKPVDWDALFEGYGAAVDWPACHFWKELLAHYPDARVLLTVRDAERWYQSMYDTIYQALTRPHRRPLPNGQRDMARKIILEQTFAGRFADRDYAIAVYERHKAEVQQVVPADRLLVYQVSEGWEPLCRFLNRPLPEAPFPRLNSTAEFQKRFGRR